MDWRPDDVTSWDPSSSTTSVNMTFFYHNGAHSGGSSSLDGGGGGAGGHALGGWGGAGKAFSFDGAGVVYSYCSLAGESRRVPVHRASVGLLAGVGPAVPGCFALPCAGEVIRILL